MLKMTVLVFKILEWLGKLMENCQKKTYDINVGELKKYGRFKAVLVSISK